MSRSTADDRQLFQHFVLALCIRGVKTSPDAPAVTQFEVILWVDPSSASPRAIWSLDPSITKRIIEKVVDAKCAVYQVKVE